MEYKIGQIFEIDDVWYQFVEYNRDICKSCVFYQSEIKCSNPDEGVKCSKWHRKDGMGGHFVRLLPIGDVYEQGGAMWQQYKCVDKPNTEDKRVYISHTDSDIGLIISVRLTENDDLNLIERKIGEIFEHNGEWYQCVKQNGCCNCAFYNTSCHLVDELSCDSLNKKRKEKYIFKKLEKVGERITVKSRTFQKLTSDNNSCKECVFNVPNKGCCKNSYIEGICDDNGFWIEIKQNKEDMEENNNAKHSNSENIGKNLKPFDLQAAKSGKPVCTRDGRKARIICFDRNNTINKPIVALVTHNDGQEYLSMYHLDGRYNKSGDDFDLMMLPEKKEGWVNVSKYSVFSSKEEALSYKTHDIIDTVKVSWEE